MDTYQNVRNHLEFLGYTLSEKELSHQAGVVSGKKHFLAKIGGNKTSFFIAYSPNAGFSFVSSYITKPNSLNNRSKFLELLNKMTAESYLASFVVSVDYKNVFLLAWYPDSYNKVSFGNFLERLESDIKFAISNNPEILNFIE